MNSMSSTKRVFRAGPKRRVKRRISVIEHPVQTSSASITLTTMTRDETLVRAILDFHVRLVGSTTGTFEWILQRAPLGVIPTAAVNSATTHVDDVSKDELFRAFSSNSKGSDVGEDPAIRYQVDLKSMRKFNESDLLAISADANAASTFVLTGTIVTFWKQV